MAKKKESTKERYLRYESEIVKVIKDHNLMNITSIFAFWDGVQNAQFYNLELEKSDTIKAAITKNKLKTKQALWNKWFKSTNATLQIALYKSICDDEERKKLSQQYIEQQNTNITEPPLFPDTQKDDE